MDSLSQIVLGAAVGELLLGRRLGNKAMLIGAIGGTIPDLDVFLNPLFTDEITKLQIHRGYSHSMFVHLLLALPFAALTKKIFNNTFSFKYWYLTWYFLFFTHVILDCCTTYGTQLFLPFTNFLVGFNNIAVVDVFWTIPFLLMLVVCMFFHRSNCWRKRWAWISMSYALLYMGFTFYNKFEVSKKFAEELQKQNIQGVELYTSPMMLSNFVWSGIAVSPDSIYIGEYSFLQKEENVEWVSYPRNVYLADIHQAQREIGVLRWFAQGKYFIVDEGDELAFYNVKWGRMDFTKTKPEEAFVFHYNIKREDGKWKAFVKGGDMSEEKISEALNALWNRVWSNEVKGAGVAEQPTN